MIKMNRVNVNLKAFIIISCLYLVGCCRQQNPPVCTNSSMFYDQATNTVILLVGGGKGLYESSYYRPLEIWNFNDSKWSLLSNDLDVSKISSYAAFDSQTSMLLFFSLFPENYGTYGWDGAICRKYSNEIPIHDSYPTSLFYNPNSQRIEYYDFIDLKCYYFNQGHWLVDEDVTLATSDEDLRPYCWYDPSENRLLCFGDIKKTSERHLLYLKEGKWNYLCQMPESVGIVEGFIYDSSRNKMIMLARTFGDDTLQFFDLWKDGLVKVPSVGSPTNRSQAAFCFNSHDDCIILYGGMTSELFSVKYYPETWKIIYQPENNTYYWQKL